MNELIKITERNGNQVVNARDLYDYLEVPTDFTTWCKRMFEYGFTENQDYVILPKNGENRNKGRKSADFALSMDCAKEISMLQRTDKGKQARQYFIECEKKISQPKQLSAREMALMVIKAEDEKEAALMQLEQATVTIKEQAPKVEYANRVLNASGAHRITIIAKELGMSAIELNEFLRQCKVQYKVEGQWVLTTRYQNEGYTKTTTYTFTDSEGKERSSIQTLWTEKGRAFIHHLISLKKTG